MKIRRERLRVGMLAVLIPLAARVPLHAAEVTRHTIAARIVSVAADKSTAVINRGKAEAIIPGSPVVIRPNRGNNEADIEWDIPFAKGVVQSVGKDTSVVKLTDVWQDIQARDYCEVDADIPVAIRDADLCRIVLFDVTLTDYANRAPLFTLADFLRAFSSKAADAVITKLLGEIRTTNSAVFAEKFKTDRIKGGLYNGLTLREAFQAATREHVEKFVEHTAWFAGRLVGYDWLLIDLYANWAYGGTLSGEQAKKAHQAGPAVKSGDGLVAKGQFVESLAEYNRAMLIDPENAEAKTKIETLNRIIERLRILQQDDKDVPTRRGLGLDFFELRLYARAAEELQKAQALGDDSLEVRRYLGYRPRRPQSFSGGPPPARAPGGRASRRCGDPAMARFRPAERDPGQAGT